MQIQQSNGVNCAVSAPPVCRTRIHLTQRPERARGARLATAAPQFHPAKRRLGRSSCSVCERPPSRERLDRQSVWSKLLACGGGLRRATIRPDSYKCACHTCPNSCSRAPHIRKSCATVGGKGRRVPPRGPGGAPPWPPPPALPPLPRAAPRRQPPPPPSPPPAPANEFSQLHWRGIAGSAGLAPPAQDGGQTDLLLGLQPVLHLRALESLVRLAQRQPRRALGHLPSGPGPDQSMASEAII